MISGIALLTSLLFAAPPSPAASPEGATAETTTLIGRLRLPTPADTAYAETRFVHVLRKPLQLRGELHYGGPGVLGKRVDEPYRETTSIANGEVEVLREGKSARKFSLERAPELQALLTSFSALLGGDAAGLDRNFTIALARGDSGWQLKLTPRAPELARHLRDLVVDGRDAEVRCVTLHESDGDSSVMRMAALASVTVPEPTPAALAALCRGSAR
jgi:outer membrane lipoprotein carrier protein LolA